MTTGPRTRVRERRAAGDDPRSVRRDPAAVRCYSWAVLAVALVAGAGVAVAGAPLPSVPPVLVLVAVMALAINRMALFPSEWSVTAEAAVVVAAIVSMAGGAALLGPWLVGGAAGPLDLLHVRERVYSRMAYNAGNRMLAALLGAVAFASVQDAPVTAPPLRFTLAALAASISFAAVDLIGYVGFERLRSHTSVRAAVRDDLFLDSLTIPLGLLGALAGWLAGVVGWWAAALTLVPVVFVPELLVVRTRRAVARGQTRRVVQRVASVVLACALLVAAAAFAPIPDTSVAAGLVALSVVLALELRVDRQVPVEPLVTLGVAAAFVVARGATVVGALLVAVPATTTSWLFSRDHRWWPPLLAALGALAAAGTFALSPTRGGALAAAVVFEIVVAARWSRLLWTAPIVSAAIAFASVWFAIGDGGAVVFVLALVVVAVAVSAWGAPPWNSRRLGPWSARWHGGRRAALAATALSSMACGVVALLGPGWRDAWVGAAGGLAAGAVAMAAVGARQWRFAPRSRRRDASVLAVAALVALLVYPALALDRDVSSLAVLGAVLATSITIGLPIATRLDRATRTPAGGSR
ncbi:MAG TPA: hypothetical protein VH986_10985 [Acidimicrobiia bacterium]|jgi:hypothetical protein